jgi:nitrogen fixation NifU-like protein
MIGRHDKAILQGFGIEVHRQEENVGSNVSTPGCLHVTIPLMYSSQLLDHFEHPRNPGEVADPDATVQLENPACGDILKLSVKLTNGHISEIRFLAKGCVPAMACGSVLTELVKGRTVAAASQLRREELVQAVGGLPEASTHASHLAMDALEAALNQIKS